MDRDVQIIDGVKDSDSIVVAGELLREGSVVSAKEERQ
jgi:hypothetical protein